MAESGQLYHETKKIDYPVCQNWWSHCAHQHSHLGWRRQSKGQSQLCLQLLSLSLHTEDWWYLHYVLRISPIATVCPSCYLGLKDCYGSMMTLWVEDDSKSKVRTCYDRLKDELLGLGFWAMDDPNSTMWKYKYLQTCAQLYPQEKDLCQTMCATVHHHKLRYGIDHNSYSSI